MPGKGALNIRGMQEKVAWKKKGCERKGVKDKVHGRVL